MINALIFSIFLIYSSSFTWLCNTSCWVTAFITHKWNKSVHATAIPWIYYQSFFYSPTDAQVNFLKNNFKIYIKINIKTAPTCFGAVTPSSGSACLASMTSNATLPLHTQVHARSHTNTHIVKTVCNVWRVTNNEKKGWRSGQWYTTSTCSTF
jgi:hypothetical protein